MWEDELFDEIQKGDDVYYENEQGQTCKGTAMLIGPAGWVLKIANGSKVCLLYTSPSPRDPL